MVSLLAAPSDGQDCILPMFISNTDFGGPSVTVTAGNPYPSDWPVMVMALPGGGLLTVVPLDTLTGAVGPLVSSPVDLRVNGHSPPFSGVGTTPTLSFTAPSIGSPDAYVIDLVEAVPSNEAGLDLLAKITTSATSFTLPPGLLRQGHAYGFRVIALKGGSAAAPYRWWRATGYGEARSAAQPLSP
jgi:hypothetical protein